MTTPPGSNEWMKKKKRENFGSPFSINHTHNCDSIRPRTNNFMPTHRFQFLVGLDKSHFYSISSVSKMSKAAWCVISFFCVADPIQIELWKWAKNLSNQQTKQSFSLHFREAIWWRYKLSFICQKSHETEEQDWNGNKRD